MMTFFRRFATSPLGLAVFGIIIVAFIVTLYEGRSGLGGAAGGGSGLARVGSVSILEGEATRRVQNQLDSARQQQPALDMNAFVAQGGVEQTIEQMINGRALELFAADQGLVASKRLVDGAIASIPAFNGPNGQFDRTTFLALLEQRKIPEAQLREDFAREAVTKALLVPVAGAARTPNGVVERYASLLLEARSGQIAMVPTTSFRSNDPVTPADVKTFYDRNLARYTVPERRTIRYATFDRTRFEGKVAPTDAEIAASYRTNAARYAGRETRGFTQIIVQQKADADRLVAAVKGGTAMAAAARSAGLEALTVAPTDKAAFAKLTGPRVADAAFAAPRGSIAPLAQSGLGYHIVKVDSVVGIAPRSLEQARGEIAGELTKVKVDEALADFVAKVEDDINGGATFDDVAKTYGLAALATPAITAGGLAPDQQGFALPDVVRPLLTDAFRAEAGDDPQVASSANGTAYVLYHMDRVIPAAPRPLQAIAAQVQTDLRIDRAARSARRVADAIVAAINKGTPFAQALAASGVTLPPARPAGGRRIDIAQAGEKVPPPVAMMFSMAQKRAKVLALPGGAGWYVVYLDQIVAADAKAAAPLIAPTAQQLNRVVGDEYVAQFAAAIKTTIGVSKNNGAIAAFKRTLTGAGR